MKFAQYFDEACCHGHAKRFALSLEWLEPLLTPGSVVYDFGQDLEHCPLETVVRRLFPQVTLLTTGDADVRYPVPVPDAVADGVCVCEILEHMKDRTEDRVDEFTHSGIRNILSEAFRVLKPGGWAFFSTPNGSQYGCAWRLVRGGSPLWCDVHTHEYAWDEFRWFVTTAGFRIERIEAVNVWEELECPQELRDVMDRLCPDVQRGHCIFCLARKPEAA